MNTAAMTADEYRKAKKGTWTQTFTGKKFHPYAPQADQIDIHDIAHALGMNVRWNGHIKNFYSVAEHSIHVASLVPPRARMWALMHDAAEAYIGDLPKPVKDFMPEFEHCELNIELAIIEKFNIPIDDEIHTLVKTADRWMLHQEGKRLLQNPELIRDWSTSVIPFNGAKEVEIRCWSPEQAADRFIVNFRKLQALYPVQSPASIIG